MKTLFTIDEEYDLSATDFINLMLTRKHKINGDDIKIILARLASKIDREEKRREEKESLRIRDNANAL